MAPIPMITSAAAPNPSCSRKHLHRRRLRPLPTHISITHIRPSIQPVQHQQERIRKSKDI
ncbi:hypothetical protein NXS19_009697 [Fusarium pseudograminearum]|nr:hypothetical protein NXS19_009697 [Fusarium pseudograminearum]